MSLRFVIKHLTAIPAPAPTGSKLLDRLARMSHRGFYLLVLSQVVTGLVMAFQAHLPQILLLGQPGHLPATFWIFPTRGLHFVVSRILMSLIALHIAGVLYHTFIRRDHLLRRMWFGKRRLVPGDETGLRTVTASQAAP
jgi:cytochrome b561